MSLSHYKQKRSATKTPEPFGGVSEGKALHFVIQKHDASHLHYDFRLEMGGVLKSWAVPKGPSTDPDIKRLAMMVEDHPYDYRKFEGIIPKGQYGGGTVIVWDEGTYEPATAEAGDLKKQEKELLQQLRGGKLKFVLHGKKLKGTFALVKAHGRGENGWLLMKLEDKYSDSGDILEKDRSVLSRKTIAQMEKAPVQVYGKATGKVALAKATAPAKAAAKKATAKKTPVKKTAAKKGNTKGKRLPFYDHVQPMLATLTDEAFDEDGWLYEIKWDGYRALAFMNKGKTELQSRNEKSFNEKFYPVYNALAASGLNAILDGEIVVTNKEGTANFGALQNWRSEADGDLLYYVFDLLWLDGYDLRALPLTERKKILEDILPDHPLIRISEGFETSGIEFLEAVRKMGMEGIMAKRKDSTYETGMRTRDWLKIKASQRQEVVIGGYTKNQGSVKPFSSLLVGVFEGKDFIYTGKIGTGFNIKTQQDMLQQFKKLVIPEPAFSSKPDVNKPSRFRPDPPKAAATWLKPQLVCEVSFAEMTADGVMRHPSFEGMRSDKPAQKVVMEKAVKASSVTAKGKKALVKPTKARERKTLLNPSEDTQVKKINGHELKFTNLSKIYWPADGISKRDMINYYYQVAPYILPYLRDRPLSLNRHPNGIKGKSFYQKDVTGKAPGWARLHQYHTDDEDTDKHFLVGHDEATLLYMAGLGCIEMNPWSSTVHKPAKPDWCIIDLDPARQTFDQVITAAQVTRQVLEDLKVSSYCKTSGSTGLHIYIPLGGKYDYEQSKEFARIVVQLVHAEIPAYTSLERVVSKRRGKMYLDFLQNRPQATIAAPYSLRPKPGATVSMPLHWEEVKKGLKMADFTIHNAVERVRSEGDLFKPVLGRGINLDKVIKAFEQRSAE